MSRTRPVTIRGKRYKTIAEASKALGVVPLTIRRAISERRLKSVGLSYQGRGKGRPVTIEGVTYKSLIEAQRQTGISYWTLRDISLAQFPPEKAHA
jgi:hypothetical protein